jgi:outer membrane protein assembly factor BamB
MIDPQLALSWPQWRGPRRDGHAPATKLTFPATLKTVWKVPLGIGYSSPTVAAGRLYVLERDGVAGLESCVCRNAATGKMLWKQSWPSTFTPPDPTAGRGPNSTVTIDNDRVYSLGLGGMFHCFEAKTGRILWKHDCAAEFWGVEKGTAGDAWFPVCGASSSALVHGNEVIVSVGGKKAGSITAFDRKTGKILWKALDDRSSYASPIRATLAGVPQLVAFTGLRMVGLDEKTHKLLWEFPFKAGFEQTIVSPVIWKDTVFILGEARPTTALQIGAKGVGVAWTSAELCSYLVTPVVVKDHLIGCDIRSRRLVCLDAATGKSTWTSPRMGKMFSSLVVVGDDLLWLSDSGELHIVAADPKAFTLKKTYKVAAPETIWSHPALVGNRLYIRDQKELTCYALS